MSLSPIEIVDRLVHAIETANEAALEAIYADDATHWANFTRTTHSKAHSIATLLRTAGAGAIRFTRSDIQTVGDQVFLRHVMTITTHAGPVLDIPVALFITTKAGQIIQAFEYVDSAQFMVPGFAEVVARPSDR